MNSDFAARWGYDVRPNEIEKESFRIIEGLADLSQFSPEEKALVARVIHATGDPSFCNIVKWSSGAFEKGIAAIKSGAPIVTDVEMARAGVSKVRAAKFGSTTHCYISDEEVVKSAREREVTRSIAAVEKAAVDYPGAIFVFGNAPTALFRLLELVDEGVATPSLVIGVVVGFVGAEESKDAMMKRDDFEWVSVKGRKGGSNVAAACVNALFKGAAKEV